MQSVSDQACVHPHVSEGAAGGCVGTHNPIRGYATPLPNLSPNPQTRL